MPYIGYQPKDQQFVSPCAIRISDCPTTMGTLGLGDLGCPLMCWHVTSLPKAIPPAGSLKKTHHSGRPGVRSFVSASHFSFLTSFLLPLGSQRKEALHFCEVPSLRRHQLLQQRHVPVRKPCFIIRLPRQGTVGLPPY